MKNLLKLTICLSVFCLALWGFSTANAGRVHGKGWAKGKGVASGHMVAAGKGTASGTGMVIWKDRNGHIHTKRGTGTVSGRGIAIGTGTVCGKGRVVGKGWAAGKGRAGHFK